MNYGGKNIPAWRIDKPATGQKVVAVRYNNGHPYIELLYYAVCLHDQRKKQFHVDNGFHKDCEDIANYMDYPADDVIGWLPLPKLPNRDTIQQYLKIK